MSSFADATPGESDEAAWQPPPEPLDPAKPPARDGYCDLILKGGVVDGVVYPGALMELARRFRFQSLAGTSVGAIAAALGAACEYSRRFGSDHGFNDVLRTLPRELAKPAPNRPGQTTLESLFQTTSSLRRPFKVLVEVLSVRRGQTFGALSRSIGSAYAAALWWGFALVVSVWGVHGYRALGHDFEGPSWWIEAAILTVASGALALIPLVLTLLVDVKHLAEQPGWGFCSGMSTDGGKTEGLTEWLHRGIQGAAGLPLSRPLTFKDLWDAPGGPPDRGDGNPTRSIDLRMVTTCLSHGRPYELPLRKGSSRLFFRPCELERYFPEAIVQHLIERCKPYDYEDMDVMPGRILPTEQLPPKLNSPFPERTAPPCACVHLCKGLPGNADCKRRQIYELPTGDLPVVVAVRLSMCFPLLFQAIPLIAIDNEAGRTLHIPFAEFAPRFKTAWFVDGGVTSNFPLHFFDAPFPNWPTFGVYIRDVYRRDWLPPSQAGDARDVPPKVDVTEFHTSGRHEKWQPPHLDPEHDDSRFGRLIGFVLSLAFTSKDWADNANLRLPGTRDRVAVIYKNLETRGGLNLKLNGREICQFAYGAGTEAGRSLAAKFSQGTARNSMAPAACPGWRDHRWVRFNAYVAALRAHVRGFSSAIGPALGAPSLRDQIQAAQQSPPLHQRDLEEHVLSASQADALLKVVDAVEELERALAGSDVVQPYEARPQVELAARSPM